MQTHNSINNLIAIQNNLKSKNFNTKLPTIIAVSKNFSLLDIKPLIDYGHLNFGENKVQEAIQKWDNIKKNSPKIQLHMIGKLQVNKVKYAVPLFDYIHTLDNIKLADKIANEEIKNNKRIKLFIQVNIGAESQKNGVLPSDLRDLYDHCKNKLRLNILGLMCIPPINNSFKFFKEMNNLNKELKLTELSMGMSNDYLEAAENEATYLRIGSSIFGSR